MMKTKRDVVLVLANVRREAVDRRRRIVADAIHVAHVEVQADGRRIDVLPEFQELVSRLDEQVRLRFDQKHHTFLLRVFDHRLQHLDEQRQAVGPLPALDRAAGFLDEGTGDPLSRAQLYDFQASLESARGNHDLALAALETVRAIHHERGDRRDSRPLCDCG